jgi:hypothetical protein
LRAASRIPLRRIRNSPANCPLRRDHNTLIFSAASFYESDRLEGLNRVFSSAQLSLYGTTMNGVTSILLNFHSPFCLTISSL